jgi:hypothetical protein
MATASCGTCYVCKRPVEPVSLAEQLEARRAMNVPVWLLSPGIKAEHPDGIVRHSYCAAGSERWKQSLTDSPSDVLWSSFYEEA